MVWNDRTAHKEAIRKSKPKLMTPMQTERWFRNDSTEGSIVFSDSYLTVWLVRLFMEGNKEFLDLVSRVYDYQEIERETQKKRDGYGLKYAWHYKQQKSISAVDH